MIPEHILARLETPCMVFDMARVRANLAREQKLADDCGVALRPHIKTHKIVEIARMQRDLGARGITCAKVSEAEVMADGGLTDIFIAYPMVGDFRVRRALALQKRVERLILAVDSVEGARSLSDAARAAGQTLEVRLEVDTGARRTGVQALSLIATARAVAALPGLNLTGIYTFKGAMVAGQATRDTEEAGREEGELLEGIASALRAQGIEIREISAGSSPTADSVARTGKVTEIRPGTYALGDLSLVRQGGCAEGDLAAAVVVTVVSTPAPDYAVIDGGSKTFPMDLTLGKPPSFHTGYAYALERPDLALTRLYEEHGMLHAGGGETRLRVGQKLALYPGHVCPTVNLQNQVMLLENGALRAARVDARGMLV